MAYCARCGHDLGEASLCPRCGTRAVRSTWPASPTTTAPRIAATLGDTAERPLVLADPDATVVPPPSAEPTPSHARFPLFADEVPTQDPASLDHPPVAPPGVDGRDRSLAELLPWALLGIAAVGIVLVLAIWLLFRPGSDGPAPAGSAGSDPTGNGSATTDDPADEGDGRSDGDGDGSAGGGKGRVRDVAARATALVPATAPPNQDVGGRPVRYDAGMMFDGDPTTAWRMPGDGTDALITIRLAGPTEVRSVGLVNGYAKEAVDGQGRTIRWYLRNRRVTAVSWSFDDGSVVEQRLRQRPRLQTLDVGSEVTSTIRLRLLGVTAPMGGGLGRDFTALSEVSIRGVPQR